MNKVAIQAIILDIDGTLSPEVSWLALTRDLGASVSAHSKIFDDYKNGRISYPESRQQLIALWRSTGNANRAYLEKIFLKWPLINQAEVVISLLRERYTLCLITGSVDLYAEIIAKRLAIDNWYANTPLKWNKDQLVGYEYHLDQADKKLEQLHMFCSSQGIDPSRCVAVGDSENDLKLFTATSRGVLVENSLASSDLRSHAWRSIKDLQELPEVLASSE